MGVSEKKPETRIKAPPKDLILPNQILPQNLFILPVTNMIAFPTMMAPLVVSVPRHIKTVEEVLSRNRILGLLLTRKGDVGEKTELKDLHSVGVAVKILKRIKMPDGSLNLLIHSMSRFAVKKSLSLRPHIVVETKYLEDQVEKSTEMDALTRTVITHVKKLAEVNPFFTEEMRLAMLNAPGPGTVADLVAFTLSLPKNELQDFVETLSVKERFLKLLVHLKREQDVADLQRKIQDDVNSKINTMQREFFLKEQLRVIKSELGMEEDDKSKAGRTFREKIKASGADEKVMKTVLNEIEKFETLSEHSPEYNTLRNYLETICNLPWGISTEDNLDTRRARKILNEDHYGLEQVKDRIVEFLAVRVLKLKRESKKKKSYPTSYPATHPAKGSIICLIGPPGVGKTSVGKSIARTMGREFFRFSLGGMRDEAEIKGHRRTYIGAMPGKIIQAVTRAGTKNPVIMLDEIDKLGQSFQGDPASALLEVLDPEQNFAFLDHYVDIPFDLSKVLFVATANNKSSIPGPLLDRMEVIELPGYTLEEKEEIAADFVVPKVLEENGLNSQLLKFEKSALKAIMLDYAREPGLRTLQQLVEKIARKAAAQIVGRTKKRKSKKIIIKKEGLSKWLGPKRYENEVAERITVPGVVTGLAWTAMGGDTLFIEATDVPGSGKLKLTGQMGEVMTESAAIAWSYVKKKLGLEYSLDEQFFGKKDIHLHIPSGAIPKDGPSAGITMATALYSLMTGRLARQKIAMTGEISLTGKVLPVGGIKEKILAARRAGIYKVILPKSNKKELSEIPKYALKGMSLIWVSHVEEVFKLALEEKGSKAAVISHSGTKNTNRSRSSSLQN